MAKKGRKLTKQEKGAIKLINQLSASFLKAFPKASPKIKAQFKPLRVKDYE